MSHRQNAATTELLRLFKGPKELHASRSGKVAERLPRAYDVALHRMVERGLKASDLDTAFPCVIGATAGAAGGQAPRGGPRLHLETLRKGRGALPTESDQTARLARTTALALDTWHGDLGAVREFFATPHPELGGDRPVDAMRTDSGARLVEDILNRLKHGLPV